MSYSLRISALIDEASDELWDISQEIYNNPETKFEEFKACELLCNWFDQRGWSVERGVYSLATAFKATFSVLPGRTICYNAEYDALPIGHACGHNLIATSSLASAIALSGIMRKHLIPGTLVVMGTPGEETGGGKDLMARHGAWKDCDAAIMQHPMPQFSTGMCNTKASLKFRAEFHGTTAHPTNNPSICRNACDAIVGAYNGLAYLRQFIAKTESIQAVIQYAGEVPNVVPDFAKGAFSLRATDAPALYRLKERVIPVFEGAAMSTGCTVELFWDVIYEDVVNNQAMAQKYQDYMATLGITMCSIEKSFIEHDQQGSSDFGNCTYICPGIQPMFRIDAQDMPHTPAFHEAAGTRFAHEEALRTGKANAMVGLDILTDDVFYAKIRVEWETAMKKAGRNV